MPRSKQEPLIKFYNDNSDLLEIGVDEAGRGPLFGRVYTAAVILPKEDGGNGCETEKKVFDYHKMKDSKKFTSSKKILEVAEHIKANALAWSVTYNDETTIDKINIRQSVLSSMHQSIKNVMDTYNNVDTGTGTGTGTVAEFSDFVNINDYIDKRVRYYVSEFLSHFQSPLNNILSCLDNLLVLHNNILSELLPLHHPFQEPLNNIQASFDNVVVLHNNIPSKSSHSHYPF